MKIQIDSPSLFSSSPSSLVRTVRLPRLMFAHRPPLLGAWMTLTRVGETEVVVTAGPGANFILASVFSAVLNNSHMVDYTSSSRGLDSFYFTKSDSWQATEDIAQLR